MSDSNLFVFKMYKHLLLLSIKDKQLNYVVKRLDKTSQKKTYAWHNHMEKYSTSLSGKC